MSYEYNTLGQKQGQPQNSQRVQMHETVKRLVGTQYKQFTPEKPHNNDIKGVSNVVKIITAFLTIITPKRSKRRR